MQVGSSSKRKKKKKETKNDISGSKYRNSSYPQRYESANNERLSFSNDSLSPSANCCHAFDTPKSIISNILTHIYACVNDIVSFAAVARSNSTETSIRLTPKRMKCSIQISVGS